MQSGLQVGLTIREAWSAPFGLLQDIIAIDMIKRDEWERVLSQEEEVEDLFYLLSIN